MTEEPQEKKAYEPVGSVENLVITVAGHDAPVEVSEWPHTPEDPQVARALAEHPQVKEQGDPDPEPEPSEAAEPAPEEQASEAQPQAPASEAEAPSEA